MTNLVNANQITIALLHNKFSSTELQVIRQAWIAANKKLQSDQKRKFRVGHKVTFTSRSGETIEGTVTKINPKTIQVLTTGGTRWKVSPGLLTNIG